MSTARRWQLLALWTILCMVPLLHPLRSLIELSVSNDDASYLLLIPFMSAGMLYFQRRDLAHSSSSDLGTGSCLIFLGSALIAATWLMRARLTADLQLSLYILALLLWWLSGFFLFLGRAATKAASFPLAFLLLMVPPPQFLLQRIIYLLRVGSADVTGFLFDLFGIPALREGFVFHLAQVNIEVAKECSGIRSSVALLLLALPLAHFGLRRFWQRATFLAVALLMTVIKNGIRIVTLTVLAIKVDPSFLSGRLHHEGGVLFFCLGLLLLLPVYEVLRRDPFDSSKVVTRNVPNSGPPH